MACRDDGKDADGEMEEGIQKMGASSFSSDDCLSHRMKKDGRRSYIDEGGKVKRKRLFLYFSPVLFHFLSQLAHGYDEDDEVRKRLLHKLEGKLEDERVREGKKMLTSLMLLVTLKRGRERKEEKCVDSDRSANGGKVQ